MKKTITCLAVLASATALAADKKEVREPAAAPTGPAGVYVGCKPVGAVYKGEEAFRNDCVARIQTFESEAEGFRGSPSRQVPGCDKNHQLIVSTTPISFRCIPPGVLEL